MIHWFDIFVLLFLLFTAFFSYRNGFIKEVFSILSLVAGYLVASIFHSEFTHLFESISKEQPLREAASFISVFIVVVIAVVIAGIYIRRVLRLSDTLSAADRIAGAGIGVVKGFAILAVLAYPLALLPGINFDLTKGSITGPLIASLSNEIVEKLAPSLAKNKPEAFDKAKAAKRAGRIDRKNQRKAGSVKNRGS